MSESKYEQQAQALLDRFGLTFRATRSGDRCPPWCGEEGRGCCHGDRYRVTIWRDHKRDPSVRSYLGRDGAGQEARFCEHVDHPKRITFDFWNSQHDMQEGKSPTVYDVLSCIGADVGLPDAFEEYCREFGGDEDSRKALRTFARVDKLAKRLRAFFTEDEIEALGDIR